MKLELFPCIEPQNARIFLSRQKGMYFWFDKDSDQVVYIGIALGHGGLRRRIVSQHLNKNYLEFRPQKQSPKDDFQLHHPIYKASKDGQIQLKGIDKSALRKSIGRLKELKAGEETVNYIIDNLYLKIFESDDIELIKEQEILLIEKYQPTFNTAYKSNYL